MRRATPAVDPRPRLRPALLAGLLWTLGGLPSAAPAACQVSVDALEAESLADKVWRNETGGDVDKLLWWNAGEDFASLGIGHFIWYPPGGSGPFRESFPDLLAFLAARGVNLPVWLADTDSARSPWRTRDEFLAERYGPEAAELRRLLADTVALQAEFLLLRVQGVLELMLADAPPERASLIESRFCVLADLPQGRYALVDYVNFKGEGVDPRERYAGQGWGLKQVLEEMRGGQAAHVDFRDAAARVLEQRVRNAPPGRREQRWLPGWLRRVDSYAND